MVVCGDYLTSKGMVACGDYLTSNAMVACGDQSLHPPTIRGGLGPFSMPHRRWGLEILHKPCGVSHLGGGSFLDVCSWDAKALEFTIRHFTNQIIEINIKYTVPFILISPCKLWWLFDVRSYGRMRWWFDVISYGYGLVGPNINMHDTVIFLIIQSIFFILSSWNKRTRGGGLWLKLWYYLFWDLAFDRTIYYAIIQCTDVYYWALRFAPIMTHLQIADLDIPRRESWYIFSIQHESSTRLTRSCINRTWSLIIDL